MEAGPETCFLGPGFYYNLLFDVLVTRPHPSSPDTHTHLLALAATLLAGEAHRELCCADMDDNSGCGREAECKYLCLVAILFSPLLIPFPLYNEAGGNMMSPSFVYFVTLL